MGSIIVPREPKGAGLRERAEREGEQGGERLYAAGLNMLPMGA